MPMDNDEYVARLTKIRKGLGDLSDDLYHAREDDVPKNERRALMDSARTRLAEYDKFLAMLNAVERSQAEDTCGHDIRDLRERLSYLESLEQP